MGDLATRLPVGGTPWQPAPPLDEAQNQTAPIVVTPSPTRVPKGGTPWQPVASASPQSSTEQPPQTPTRVPKGGTPWKPVAAPLPAEDKAALDAEIAAPAPGGYSYASVASGGFKAGLADIAHDASATSQAMHGETPTAAVAPDAMDQRYGAPFQPGTMPNADTGKKVFYHLTKGSTASAPEMVGAGVGGAMGSEFGPAGTMVGGGLGAFVTHIYTKSAPVFAEEIKATPNDPEGAYKRTAAKVGIGAVATGLGFGAFGANPFDNEIKNLLFQAFGVQPSVAMVETQATNLASGKPVNEGVAAAGVEAPLAVIGPAGAHMAAVRGGRAALADSPVTAAAKAHMATDFDPATAPGVAANLLSPDEGYTPPPLPPANVASPGAPSQRVNPEAPQGTPATIPENPPVLSTAPVATPATAAPPQTDQTDTSLHDRALEIYRDPENTKSIAQIEADLLNQPPEDTPPAGQVSVTPSVTEQPAPQQADLLGQTPGPVRMPKGAKPVSPSVNENRPERPRTIIDEIRDAGGLQPSGETKGRDLHSVFPGLVRKNGMPEDQLAGHLGELGYFPATSEGASAHDLWKAIDQHIASKGGGMAPVYSPADAHLVPAWEARFQENPERAGLEERAADLGVGHEGLDDSELMHRLAEGQVLGEHEAATSPAEDATISQGVHDDVWNLLTEIDGGRRAASTPGAKIGRFAVPREPEAATPAAAAVPPMGAPEARPGAGVVRTGEDQRSTAGTPEEIGRGGGQAEGGSGVRAEPIPATEPVATVDGRRDQFVIPGTEQSAVQAAEGREASGKGRIVPQKTQKEADHGMFAAPAGPAGPDLLTPRAEPHAAKPEPLADQTPSVDSARGPVPEEMQSATKRMVKRVHGLAEQHGVDVNTAEFRTWSKHLTGEEHLDNMSRDQLGRVVSMIGRTEKVPGGFELAPRKGTVESPVTVEKPGHLKEARTVVDQDATRGQRKVGNYQKAHINWKGLPITIETGKGHTRTSHEVDANGKPLWEVKNYPTDYGYVKRTEAPDGEGVDIHMGPKPQSDKVYLIHQHTLDGKYDEPKVMAGFGSEKEATDAYDAGFNGDLGPKLRGRVDEMSVAKLKAMLPGMWRKKPYYRESDRGVILKDLRERLDKMGLKDVSAALINIIDDAAGKRGPNGRTQALRYKSHIDVLIGIARDMTDPTMRSQTIGHEAIHAMRMLNLISDKEWVVLERAAKANKWHEKYDIAKRYSDLDTAGRMEEAIAEAGGDHYAGVAPLKGMPARIFDRLRRILEATGNWVRGHGFQNADDVFTRLYSGEVGKRARGDGASARMGRDQTENVHNWDPSPETIKAVNDLKDGGTYNYVIFDPKDVQVLSKEQRPRDDSDPEQFKLGQPYKGDANTPEGDQVWKGPATEKPASLLGLDFAVPDKGVVDVLRNNTLPFFERLKDLRQDNWRETGRHIWDRLGDKMAYQNAYEDAIRAARGGKPIPLEERAYLHEELRPGRTGEKMDKLRHEMFEPLIDDIMGSGLNVPIIERYLHALHAEERETQIQRINPKYAEEGGGSGWQAEWGTPQEFINDLRDEGHGPALGRIERGVRNILDFQLQERVDSGLLSEKDAERLKNTYTNYVPLRGMDEMEGERSNIGQGISTKGKEFQRALGRTSAPKDILANVVMMAQEAIIRGEKNRVGNSLYNLVVSHPNDAIWTLDPTDYAPYINKSTGLVEHRPVSALSAAEADKTVVTKINGKEHRIFLHDIRLARAWKNLDMRSGNVIFDVLGGVNRYLSHMSTGLNPEFIIGNAMRDYQEAMVNIQQFNMKGLAKDVTKDYLKAVRGTWGGLERQGDSQWQKHFREFAQSGGKVSFWKADDVERMRTTFAKELALRQHGFVPWTKKTLRSIAHTIERANSSVENGIRLSFFVNLRKRGVPIEQAASAARNLTIDFNKHGSWGPMLNAMYLFYNASIQGTAVMARAMRSRPVQKLVGAMVLSGMMMDQLNGMLSPSTNNDGKSDYDKLDEFTKSRNIIISNPTGGTGFKWSTPYGYGAFFNLGRLLSAYARGAQGGAEVLKNMFIEAADAFNPVGNSQSFLNLIAPTFLDPVVDLSNNKDFAGRPIVKEVYPGQEWIPNAQRYFHNTPGAYKWASEHLNSLFGGDKYTSSGPATDIAPGVFQYLIGQLTGGAGQFAERIAELPGKLINGTATVNDVPFARRFIQEPPTFQARNEGYTAMKEVEDSMARWRAMSKDGADTIADKYWNENEPLLSLKGQAAATRKMLSQNRKDRDEIEARQVPIFVKRRLLIENAKDAEGAMTEFTTQYNAAVKEMHGDSWRQRFGQATRSEARSTFGLSQP